VRFDGSRRHSNFFLDFIKEEEKVVAKGSYYYCVECGYKSAKWAGKCPQCGAWSSFEEVEELPKHLKKATSSISVASRASDIKVYEFKDVEYNKEDYFIALRIAKELGITDMIENNDLVNRIGVTIK